MFSVLNAPLNWFLLNKLLRVANEKSVLIGLSSIKDYIRVPRITAKNQKLKDKIITLTESMLAIEDVVLRDVVDFGKLNVQRFDGISVVGHELILTNSKEFRCKIQSGKAELVQKIIRETHHQNNGFITESTITLSELKALLAIDFDKQAEIKKQIDELVFALYFDVSEKNVAKHEFYDYVNS